MGYRENLYDTVLLLHIFAVVVGFGGVYLNGLYGAAAKNAGGSSALAISEANLKVTHVAQYFIYAVPVLGVLLVWLSDGAIGFGETWVWLSLVLYAVGISLSHAVMLPTAKRMQALMRELASVGAGGGPPPPGAAGGPPPQAIEMQALGKRMGTVGMVLDVLVIVLIALMVFKPGGSVL